MQPIISFYVKHGLSIMIVGFLIFFSSFLVMVFAGKYSTGIRQAAFAGAISGFSVYVLGRISVFIAKRNKSKNPPKDEFDEF